MVRSRQFSRRSLLGALGTGLVAMAGCSSDVPDDAVSSLPTPTRGDENAASTIDVTVDYQCPHCADFHASVEPTLVEEFVETGTAQLRHRDFPLPVGDSSWPAAMAARAIQDFGEAEAFWEARDFLLRNQDRLSDETFQEIASELGVDSEAVLTETEDLVYRPVVKDDKQWGKDQGVSSTPTVLVDGEIVEPAEDESYLNAIRSVIEQEGTQS